VKFSLLAIEALKGRESLRRKVDAAKRTKEGSVLKCAAPAGPLPSLSPIRRPG
jgi:hypothetical protein